MRARVLKTKKQTTVKNESDKQYVTTREAAKVCGVSIFSVQKWFDKGLLTGSTLPGGWRRISLESLNQLMKKHNMGSSSSGESSIHRVLVVEDSGKLLSIIRDSLSQTGKYLVQTAVSGLEAGIALSQFQPHSLVLDIMLEDIPGVQLVRRIRESQHGRSIRIVAISGKSGAKDVDEILSAGANAYLKKPFQLEDLIRAIESRRVVKK